MPGLGEGKKFFHLVFFIVIFLIYVAVVGFYHIRFCTYPLQVSFPQLYLLGQTLLVPLDGRFKSLILWDLVVVVNHIH